MVIVLIIAIVMNIIVIGAGLHKSWPAQDAGDSGDSGFKLLCESLDKEFEVWAWGVRSSDSAEAKGLLELLQCQTDLASKVDS